MAKKVFSLAPGHYFTKQLARGGRDEIAWTLAGKIITKNRVRVILLDCNSIQETHHISKRQYKVDVH